MPCLVGLSVTSKGSSSWWPFSTAACINLFAAATGQRLGMVSQRHPCFLRTPSPLESVFEAGRYKDTTPHPTPVSSTCTRFNFLKAASISLRAKRVKRITVSTVLRGPSSTGSTSFMPSNCLKSKAGHCLSAPMPQIHDRIASLMAEACSTCSLFRAAKYIAAELSTCHVNGLNRQRKGFHVQALGPVKPPLHPSFTRGLI